MMSPVRSPWLRVAIEGTSMLPTLAPGEWWIAQRTDQVTPGDLVVARHPQQHLIIVKRAIRKVSDCWWIEGDNPESSDDSRQFGEIAATFIIGRLWLRYHPWSLRESRSILRQGRG